MTRPTGPSQSAHHRPSAYVQPGVTRPGFSSHPKSAGHQFRLGSYGQLQSRRYSRPFKPYGLPQHRPSASDQPQQGPSGTSLPGPSRQPQHRPSAYVQPGMTRSGFSSHPKSGHQFRLGSYGHPLFRPGKPQPGCYSRPFRPGSQPQPRIQPNGITQPRFYWQPQPGQNSQFQPRTFIDSIHHGVSGQSKFSTQPAQPEPCVESQPGPSCKTQPELQQDVPKCVYCGNNELEKFDCFLEEEEVKKIPYLCSMHFSKGSPVKKYLKEPQDPKKICLICSFYFRVYIKVCHLTCCNPDQHDPRCESCVTSTEEAGRLEHGSRLGRRDIYRAL